MPTIECPSGLVVTVREFKLADKNLLATPGLRDPMVALLDSISTRVDDPGLYEPRAGRFDWRKVLQGDANEVLRVNRIETWDPTFERTVACPSCGEPTTCEFDLRQFPVRKLPESSREHVRSGAPLRTRLPRSGQEVAFRLLRLEDEAGLEKIRESKPDKRASALVRFRVVDLPGVPPPEIERRLEDLGGADESYLAAAMEAADCGVETEHGYRCRSCRAAWTAEVPFGRGFLFPRWRGTPSLAS